MLDNARSGSLLVDCSTVSKQHSVSDPPPVPMQCAQPVLPDHNDDDENGLGGNFLAIDLYHDHPDGSLIKQFFAND